MKLKTRLWLLAILLALLWLISFLLSQPFGIPAWYAAHLYPSIQSFRHSIFGIIPFSLGDVLYFLAGVWLLITVLRWTNYVRRLGSQKELLARSLLNTTIIALSFYLLLIVSWGANYYREPLAEKWGLPLHRKASTANRKKQVTSELSNYDHFLVAQINHFAAGYKPQPLRNTNQYAEAYYREFTDSRVKQHGFGIKPGLYGFAMRYMGIDGYYNPFTSEGQVNGLAPGFMMPFLVCHEMAHQAGIASEGDANLLAYAVCTATNDPSFRYSAYFNIWLYVHHRLFILDSTLARNYRNQLNELTLAHIDTLNQLSEQYHGAFSDATSDIYDSYLRLQDQQDGIRSYSHVSREAWLLEQQRGNGKHHLIRI